MQYHECPVSSKDTVQGGKQTILCHFLYFGPYLVDIGHYFVDSVKNLLIVSYKWTLNVKAQAYK